MEMLSDAIAIRE